MTEPNRAADVHTHFLPAEVLAFLQREPRIQATLERRAPDKEPFLTVEGRWSFELKRTFVDFEAFAGAYRRAGIGLALVSPLPQLFVYHLPAEIGAQVAEVYNDALRDLLAPHRERFRPLATLPLADPVAAARELERRMDEGFVGAIVGPGVGEALIGDEAFWPVWEVADARRAVLFLHPLLHADPRAARLMLPNLVGVPWETTLAASHLVLSGLLDRYPGARVLLAHGGGFLPYQIGRIEQGYDVWPQVRGRLQDRPTAYLRRMFYDNVLWSDAALQCLIDVVGAGRVLAGSDFPFDLSAWPPRPGADVSVLVGNGERKGRSS
ncbi:amidohydrolase family protein [Alicyclobacillus acidocaldarius]|uniref:Amidohydrolase 2 n=1 Tax=Alicyclobacillus acidocaldarius subsp. acidocaldarius (strain ATCC 27009 / DSM 446 / BCRC 14685 / JCM 5260 / KCTC 1825 / NBRC 15652 / NCIMB 11725 / NRRL B-14509 / 104-IA) TaxID=521098 RepID=C8WX06_ALIAD|nr:amidohydrolase family protein [Alicyclobacillus acidocaldarius]ACV58628.1 amidohydrolase 2 [Alicyclobacillus acidocaldarius subsp. acidocaldarius DSM 446]